MAAAGIIPGFSSALDLSAASAAQVPAPKGIFGEFPGATPKYARNTGLVGDDFRESMARLFLQIGSGEKQALYDSLSDPQSKVLARVLAGTGTKGGLGYVDFILQSAQHSLVEKEDVVEVLSDNYVAYYFGQAAPLWQYQGVLVNSIQDDQAANMVRVYRDMIRGAQLARRRQLVRLRYDNMIVAGTMCQLVWALEAETEMKVPFSFSLRVKSLIFLPNDNYGLVPLHVPFAPEGLLANTAVTRPTVTNYVAAVPPEKAVAPKDAAPLEPDVAAQATFSANCGGAQATANQEVAIADPLTVVRGAIGF